ncbi:MAG: PAS domain S-box protein, partial [Candidatus Atribacteria bacterium]
MRNENKTKDQLIQELVKMRKKIADLEEITAKRKQVKTELKESEKKYKDLVEETPIGIANIGITGKIIYINKRLEKISGYSREEVVGKGVFKLGLFSNEMLKILKERLKVRFRLRGGSVRLRREIHFKRKDGKWIWIEITAKLIKKWGIPFSLRITVQDITERKRAEEKIRDSEERLKILFGYAPDAYYISDLKGNFIDGNKAAERLIGYKREELIGKSFLKLKLLSLADISKAAKALVKNIMGQPTGPDEFVLNRKDNSRVIVEISTYPVKIKGRTLVLGIA